MTDTEKCVAVLTRCGPHSRASALAFVPTLTGDEVQELVKLHLGISKLDESLPAEASPEDRKKFNEAHNGLLREVGSRFQSLANAVADRQAKDAETPQAPAPKFKPDRKRAEAAAGQAQSDGSPPLGS